MLYPPKIDILGSLNYWRSGFIGSLVSSTILPKYISQALENVYFDRFRRVHVFSPPFLNVYLMDGYYYYGTLECRLID